MKIIVAAILTSTASSMSANSLLGRSLVENSRVLKDNEYAVDTTWMTNYTIHFEKCHAVTQVYDISGQQQGGNNNNNNNNNQNNYNSQTFFTQYMAEFSLCPASSTCKSGCLNGGKYIADLGYFAQVYVEGRQEANQVACATASANCIYNDVSICYANAGLDFCYQEQNNNGNNNNNKNQNQMNVAAYMQCQALENKNYAQNNNKDNNGNYVAYTQYYLGPYCSGDGKSVKVGVFVDAGCSIFAQSGVYETLYGVSLPYSDTSVLKNDCLTCDNGASAASDMCQNAYGNALGRCESNLYNGATQDTSGCNYINDVLPAAEKASQTAKRTRTQATTIQNITYAAAGFFVLLSVALGVYTSLLQRRLKRVGKVALSDTVYDQADPKPEA